MSNAAKGFTDCKTVRVLNEGAMRPVDGLITRRSAREMAVQEMAALSIVERRPAIAGYRPAAIRRLAIKT